MKEIFIKIKDFLIKNKKVVILFLMILIFIIAMKFSLKDDLSEDLVETKNEIETQKEENTNKEDANTELFNILDCVYNTKNINSAKINAQLKFLNKIEDSNEDSYDNLLSVSLLSNYYKDMDVKNLKGFVDLNISSFDMDLSFPIIINDFGSDRFSMYMDIPSSYKSSFNMKQDQEFLFANKNSFDYIDETYHLFDSMKTSLNQDNIKNISINGLSTKNDRLDSIQALILDNKYFKNISFEDLGNSKGIYSFDLDNKEIILLVNELLFDEKYEDNILLKYFLNLFKDENTLNDTISLKGQIGVNGDIATDIYFEILHKDNSLTVARLTFNNINDGTISIETFSSEKTKDFGDFIENLHLVGIDDETIQESNSIEIGDVYFTGEDESVRLDTFNRDKLPEAINVFINFTECTAQTNLVVRWFYEDQEVPIVETKISNGEYTEGILKSSISFTDSKNTQLGTYYIRIYIEGQTNPIFEQSFEIK